MKKLMMFLMIAIPLIVVLVVNLTVNVVSGEVNIAVDGITLSKETVVANIGDEENLTYSIYPENATNKDVVWHSSDETVAHVDNAGKVDFVGFGSAYISATTLDGNKRAQCYFYITDTKVHQVVLGAKQNFVYLGKRIKVDASILPGEAENRVVTFSSSNSEIATVDANGYVTGVSVGDVTITAVSQDGNLKDDFDISVLNPVVALNVDAEEVITSSASERARFTVEPASATRKDVVFEVDNSDIATVNHLGVITFVKPGEVNLIITTVDGGFRQTVKYIYTGGYAHELILSDASIKLTVGDADYYLNYQTIPADTYMTNVTFISDNEDVAYVVNGRYLRALAGGGTIVRAIVQKNENEIIEKQILVMVESPANEVAIEDGITATNSYQLQPKSLPEGSTNSAYFYHMDAEFAHLATVDETGLVTFLGNTPCTVDITIFANEDNSDVFKKISVTYTAGKASRFVLGEHDFELNYSSVLLLPYTLVPENTSVLPMKISITSSSPVVEGGRVIEILPDNSIKAVGGGKATIKVEVTLYNDEVVEETCNISVKRAATNIEIDLGIDRYNNQYVTAKKEVDFFGTVYPIDATDKNIVWAVSDKNIASISANKLIFKQIGVVVLTATVGDVQKAVEVYYTGSVPIFAEVKATYNGEVGAVPEKIRVGDSFKVEIGSIIPTDISGTTISLQATNQRTTLTSGKVIQIEDGVVSGVAGGTATLIVYVCGSFRLSFNLQVERLPSSLEVREAGSKVTASTIDLTCDILPIDTTNKAVKFVVNTPEIASIENGTLTFKQNGVAEIYAYCEADESINQTFTIEKVESDAIIISPDEKSIVVNKGGLLAFALSGGYSIRVIASHPIIAGVQVLRVEGERVRALSAGSATIEIEADKTYTIEIEVRQLVERIAFVGDIDFVGDEFVIASNSTELKFDLSPTHAYNNAFNVSITEQDSADGKVEDIAYIVNNRIFFTKAGSVVIEATSQDGNATTTFRLHYTGGDAIDAQLNVEENLVLEVGKQQTISVVRWLPKDTTNTAFEISEATTLAGRVISLNNKTKTITALAGGQTTLVVELSNGITKEIDVKVIKKVTDIVVQDNILTALDRYEIVASAQPSDATNKTLEYILAPTSIATISGNTVYFSKAGSVNVTIRATDDSGIEKTIKITSTKGFLNNLELESNQISLTKGHTITLNPIKSPADATSSDLQFRIVGKQTIDGTDNAVISLSSDGTITALYGGTAVVRVFSHNIAGEEIYAECEIKVITSLSGFNVKFDHNLDYYQSAYITSANEIGFEFEFLPADATTRTFRYEISDSRTAKIEDGKIVFLQAGRAVIKFVSDDRAKGEISRTAVFYYTADSLIEADLNKQYIDNGVIRLRAGENFAFSLVRVVPSDNKNLTYSIRNASEVRVDPNKPVASFENGTINALNGGTYSFALYINNLLLDQLTVIVTRDAQGIDAGLDHVYISEPTYQFMAKAIPSDTQDQLGYRSKNEQIATVSPEGKVVFEKFGICEIEIYVLQHPEIYVVVTIQYTKEVQAIKFNTTVDAMFSDEYVDLTVIPEPFDADDFEFEITLENNDVARLDKQDNDYYRLKCIKLDGSEAQVKVIARVLGTDIRIEKTFTFHAKIRDVQLELDASGDVNGQGDYRVFGTQFVAADNTFVNTYQMNVNLLDVNLQPANNLKTLLEWTTSDQDIATVDQNGVVTFLKAGRVTITAAQKAPYENAKVKKDSYEFKVVNGINVENFAQFVVAHHELKTLNAQLTDKYFALVLQNNIKFEVMPEFTTVGFCYNLYGNGNLLDHTAYTNEWGVHYLVDGIKNLVIDNVTLRGTALSEKDNLSDLRQRGFTLRVNNSQNILIYNSIVENGRSNIDVINSSLTVQGCIMQNSALCGIKVNHTAEQISTLTVEDCVFGTSLFAGIIINPLRNGTGSDDKVILKGDVLFYNWATVEEIRTGFLPEITDKLKEYGLSILVDDLENQVLAIFEKQENIYYQDPATNIKYYHFGVVKFKAPDVVNLESFGTIDKSRMNTSCNYVDIIVRGAVNFKLVSVEFTFEELSLLNNNPFIKPWHRYNDAENKAKSDALRQPWDESRF